MSPPPDIRHRASRLLAGTFRPGDLEALFLWLRFNTHGKAPLVKDIGDLVAHRHEKNQGIIWQRGVDFANAVYLIWESFNERIPPVDVVREGALATLRTAGPATFESETGLSFRKAEQHLTTALDKLVFVGGRNVDFRTSLTREEAAVLQFATNRLVVPPPLTEVGLMVELEETFARLKLADSIPQHVRPQFGAFISKFFICLASGTRLTDRNGVAVGALKLGVGNPTLEIMIFSNRHHKGPVCCTLYQSSLGLDALGAPTRAWDDAECPLEIGADGLIVAMV